jgi:hypothetical protein
MEVQKIEIEKGIDVEKELAALLNKKVRNDIETIQRYSISMNGNTFLFNNCTVTHDSKKTKLILIKKQIDPRIAMQNAGIFLEYYLVSLETMKNMESDVNLEKAFEKISKFSFTNKDPKSSTSTKIYF